MPANTPVRDYSSAAAVQRAVLPARGRLDLRGGGLDAPLRTASRNGVRCRRSSDLILTVSWRFGTLRRPMIQLTGQGGVDDQVRACPTYRLAESASLSARRREHRQRHPRRDHERHGERRPRRAARLRRLFGQAPAGPHRAAIRAPAPMLRSTRSPCRSSRPARKCASA